MAHYFALILAVDLFTLSTGYTWDKWLRDDYFRKHFTTRIRSSK